MAQISNKAAKNIQLLLEMHSVHLGQGKYSTVVRIPYHTKSKLQSQIIRCIRKSCFGDCNKKRYVDKI